MRHVQTVGCAYSGTGRASNRASNEVSSVIGDLPDLDEAISFAVDDGAQAGPFPMREIVDSVRSGQRGSSTLVWWAGQPDWVAFDTVPGLLAQLELGSQPPPPSADDAPVEDAPVDDAAGDDGAVDDALVEDARIDDGVDESASDEADQSVDPDNPFADVADYSFAEESELVADDATWVDQDAPAAAEDSGDIDPHAATALISTDEGVSNATTGWGSPGDEYTEYTEAEDGWSDVSSPAATDPTETVSFGDNVDVSADYEDESDGLVEGEFGAPMDDAPTSFGGSGLFGDGPEISRDEPTSLQSVSERIEALGTEAPAAAAGGLFGSSRRIIEDAAGGGDDVASVGDDSAEVEADSAEVYEDSAESDQDGTGGDFDELEQIVEEVDQPDEIDAGAAMASADLDSATDAELDELFETMVADSRTRHQRLDWASKLDDVALGAVIASSLADGYALIDLHALAQSHQARFEHPDSHERLIIEIDSLGPASTGGELLGQHGYVTVGLGRKVRIEDMVDDDPISDQPGVIAIECDAESGYAYSTVDLIWEFDELLDVDRTLDTDAVMRRVSAAEHALRKHWVDRFGSS